MVPRADWGPSQLGLRVFLAELAGRYDVCLIDCPPNLHLCSWAALAASQGVVVPLQAEDYGAQGNNDITTATARCRAINPGLFLVGYLVTMFDRRLGLHAAYRNVLLAGYPDDLFASSVPLAKDYKEAVASRMPVENYRPKGAAAKAIREVAAELLERAAGRAAA